MIYPSELASYMYEMPDGSVVVGTTEQIRELQEADDPERVFGEQCEGKEAQA